jgi:hypothetical protein
MGGLDGEISGIFMIWTAYILIFITETLFRVRYALVHTFFPHSLTFLIPIFATHTVGPAGSVDPTYTKHP